MIGHLVWLTLGLLLLVLGAHWFLKGACGVALRYGIPPFVVGLVIVGLGTSAPELAVNISSVLRGSYGLAMGNVVGSNIANVGLILGISALVAPLAVNLRLIRVEAPLMLAVSVLLLLLCLDGELTRPNAVILLLIFVALMLFMLRGSQEESVDVQAEFTSRIDKAAVFWPSVVLLLVGLGLLIGGADMMVDSAVSLARLWGWSEVLIGLTVVAIGTSLPELASSLLAAIKGQTDIAVGNVVGSNLFNILLVLGGTAVIHPLPVDPGLLRIEIPVMIGFALLGFVLMHRMLRLSRPAGAVLLTCFVLFIGLQVMAVKA